MKSRSFWIVNGLALFALQADVALAADGEKPGSFNIFVGDLAVAFWTLLIFGLVLVVLGKFAWKPVLEGLQRREQFIRESLETAKRDRESAEARLREYEQKLVEAREEAGR
ncbi:MAG: ATP synthase F0 subunit B, partial [Phycisphaerae bacterium]|nr:ATP synthase F0 subunit B [Phycisphaerae bacterium]